MNVTLQLSTERDRPALEHWIRAYHAFEGIARPGEDLTAVIGPLLGQSELGRIWLVCADSQPVGYAAICFGYSIEFGGRDGFVDELFIVEAERGKGLGKTVLALLKWEAARLGLQALHLACARSNERARRLYLSAGFVPREPFFLMTAPLIEKASDQALQPTPGNGAAERNLRR